jgi:poly(3-hydroxybutyrate) depolymerase
VPFDELLRTHAEQDGYLLVVPDGQARFPVEWDLDGDTDLGFFDDVLACLVQQFPVDRRRVHSAGFSAGGAMSARLAERRGDRLASLVSWSGGIRDQNRKLVVGSLPRALPGLLYDGGRDDRPSWVGQAGTLELAETLLAAGEAPIVCDHGQGHTIPDTDRTFLDMGAFFLAHPFGGSDPIDAGVSLPRYCFPYP